MTAFGWDDNEGGVHAKRAAFDTVRKDFQICYTFCIDIFLKNQYNIIYTNLSHIIKI